MTGKPNLWTPDAACEQLSTVLCNMNVWMVDASSPRNAPRCTCCCCCSLLQLMLLLQTVSYKNDLQAAGVMLADAATAGQSRTFRLNAFCPCKAKGCSPLLRACLAEQHGGIVMHIITSDAEGSTALGMLLPHPELSLAPHERKQPLFQNGFWIVLLHALC